MLTILEIMCIFMRKNLGLGRMDILIFLMMGLKEWRS